MIQKREDNLSNKVNWDFYGILKIRVIMINVNIFTLHASFYLYASLV